MSHHCQSHDIKRLVMILLSKKTRPLRVSIFFSGEVQWHVMLDFKVIPVEVFHAHLASS